MRSSLTPRAALLSALLWGALGGASAISLGGCEQCGDRVPDPNARNSENSQNSGNNSGNSGNSGSYGVIEGRILFADDAELPSYPSHPMALEGRSPLPDHCTPPQRRDAQPLHLSGDGERGIGGVLVAVTEFEERVPFEPQTRRLTIRDCRLGPTLIAATRGDTLQILNETDHPLFPSIGAGSVMQALLQGQSREIPLDRGGVRSINCGFATPCGRSDLVVLYHPVFAITDEEGRFRIDNVPLGEEVRVSAWHPLLRESSEQVTARRGEPQRITLTLEPAPLRPPPTEQGPQESSTDTPF